MLLGANLFSLRADPYFEGRLKIIVAISETTYIHVPIHQQIIVLSGMSKNNKDISQLGIKFSNAN